ncbi:MAG: glycosyltransferase family 2 protein [Saprospiraceae bacterium]
MGNILRADLSKGKTKLQIKETLVRHMETLSVVIITLNEEKNIGRCLDSVQGIADEIVVVDSFSTDKTKDICLSYGVRFIQNEWLGYVDTKNLALKETSYDLVLSLDADEALSDTLKQSILHIKNNRDKDSYSFNRLTNYCGKWIKHCGWYPDVKLRLLDKTKGHWTGLDIHEQITMNSNSTIGHLKGDLYHYSYYDIGQHVAQSTKFSYISAQSFYKQGKKASILKIVFSPANRFFRDYFVHRGFLDGYEGFLISVVSAYATFLKYATLREMNKGRSI